MGRSKSGPQMPYTVLIPIQDAELCLQTIITVFRNDATATTSAVLLRLLARMIKERHYNVNPNVLTCLLHLRLRTELGLDADGKSRLKSRGRGRDDERQKAKSETRQKWMNKNRRKAEKEKKEVEKEMEEAEAEVDKEERSKVVSTNPDMRRIYAKPFPANGNPEKPVCAVLLDPEATQALANAACRYGGYCQVCASCQH